MAFQWEEFRGGPTRPSQEQLRVTLGPRGSIYFNRRAYREMGEPPALRLMFERIESMIGMAPASLDDKHAFPVKPHGVTAYTLAAAPFCRHFGIKVVRTERFDEPYVDSEGILRLDLRRTHTVGRTIGRSRPLITRGSSGIDRQTTAPLRTAPDQQVIGPR